MKFTLEDNVIEVATNRQFCIMGLPVNCKMYETNDPAYAIATRSGDVLFISKSKMENGAFVKKSKSSG